MKKYSLAIIALIFAICAMGITMPARESLRGAYFYFEFDTNSYPPTEANVEDPFKWRIAPV